MAPLDDGLGGALEVSDLAVAAAAAESQHELNVITGPRHIACMQSCGRGVSGVCMGIKNRMSCCATAADCCARCKLYASMPAHPLAGHACSAAHPASVD
jgi:hypothetical protein